MIYRKQKVRRDFTLAVGFLQILRLHLYNSYLEFSLYITGKVMINEIAIPKPIAKGRFEWSVWATYIFLLEW